MALPDLDTQLLNSTADFEEPVFGEDEILAWARHDQGGGLPFPAARPFAQWLDSGWNEYADPDNDQTNLDVLYGALSEWTGGRSIRPTDSLKASYAAACAAHVGLYEGVDDPDAPEDNGWRRGPGPLKLADFFAELSGTGTLTFLKD